jgi:hypothetical protein
MTTAFLFSLLVSQRVSAYIDPGTGGMIIQGVIGLAIGGLAALAIFWKRIIHSVKSMFNRSKNAAVENNIDNTST